MKKFLTILFIILLIIFSFIFFTYKELKYYEEILNKVEDLEFDINNYSIFGTHFNIDGCIDKILDNPKLVLKNKKEIINLDSNFYEDNNKTCFYISENINEGIYLDELKQGDYLLLIENNEEYYTLNNSTNNDDLEYYTITRNNSNNKININFEKYKDKGYINFKIKKTNLPEDVYDISIDPGHGGKDVGAIGTLNGKEYYESNLTLEVSLLIKKELEDMGLKVNITRNSDVNLDPYGENGRAVIANKTNSKYSFSIHFNSDYGVMTYGGVEIYTPNDINLTLARMFASNLSEVVGYSKNPNFKLENGVYYKCFRQSDIDDSNKSMKEENMQPYNMILGSPYMYMIREVGGIHTGAYIDGRNTLYGINPYYNSIKTAEPYLLELAYINYPNDLSKALNNIELFSNAVSKAIEEYLKY